jgi:hypothetical protein
LPDWLSPGVGSPRFSSLHFSARAAAWRRPAACAEFGVGFPRNSRSQTSGEPYHSRVVDHSVCACAFDGGPAYPVRAGAGAIAGEPGSSGECRNRATRRTCSDVGAGPWRAGATPRFWSGSRTTLSNSIEGKACPNRRFLKLRVTFRLPRNRVLWGRDRRRCQRGI